jgi:cytochrome c553
MQAFRTGERPATVMDRIARGFTDEEARAIAAWVSQRR